MSAQDILDLASRTCCDCGQGFQLTEREVDFYSEKVATIRKIGSFPAGVKPAD